MSAKIKATARGLAALGRGPDTMLVHMAPAEVAGLQKLAVASGGSLTINPKTGLPEAGWLSTLLPVLAGGVASVMTGGAASPLLIAALGAGSGALGAKVEGEDPLMGGAMGALGGFGGSGITKGLMQAGAGGAGLGAAGAQAGNASLQATNAAGAATAAANPSLAAAGLEPVKIGAQYATNVMPTGMQGLAANSKLAGQGLGSLVNPGGATAQTFWNGVKGTSNAGLTGLEKLGTGTAAMGTVNAATAPRGMDGGGKKSKPMYYHTEPVTVDPITGQTTFGGGYWSRDYDYANRGLYDPNNMIPDAPVYKQGGNPYGMAKGGLSSLVKGPGDGVSDSIPAMIDGKQPAALGSGEFVVDAHTVSRLGNGSTDAGAQRLLNMMHRINRVPTRPGKDINPESFLPA